MTWSFFETRKLDKRDLHKGMPKSMVSPLRPASPQLSRVALSGRTMLHFTRFLAMIATGVASVTAESHTIHFTNLCGFGTPIIAQNGIILSTGADFTTNGPFIDGMAYLQTGGCGLNGEGCTIVETTLRNPTTLGGNGSCTEIVQTSTDFLSIEFSYFINNSGCITITGGNCPANCSTGLVPFPSQTECVTCDLDNVNLAINLCD
ncbi:hypothetical protein SCHPADRAFT_198248 [Schizopora paradoxa]|uniref:Glycopeptide n=1 Tax=Schizopora paradoxa TaxID=27342 RepID=A0A0H2S4X8_9AGAM|nr:hypothetical protein SCHPADRAFT_198248 [Schizopora paradoxa]